MVADMAADMEVHMVADMEVDKVADMVADMFADIVTKLEVPNLARRRKIFFLPNWFSSPSKFGERVDHGAG